MEHVFRLLRSVSGKLGSALKNIFDLEASGELLVYSGVVGVVAGLGDAIFITALNWVSHLLMGGRRLRSFDPAIRCGKRQHVVRVSVRTCVERRGM